MKRNTVLIFFLFLLSSGVFAQSTYLPLGLNGTSFEISSQFNETGIQNVMFDTGYSIGGRMDLSLLGGVQFETIDGNEEVIPSFTFKYDIIMIKQQKSVPFSVKAGLGIGFSSSLKDNRSIFGTDYGYNMQLTRSFSIHRLYLGLNGLFEYNRILYEIRSPASAEDPTSTLRLHTFCYGFALDLGYKYSNENMILLRGDFLFNQDAQFNIRLKVILLVPSAK